MTTTLDIIDSAVKIGLGALIAGATTYLITIRNQKFEDKKKEIEERKSLSRELAAQLVKVEHCLGEGAFYFHNRDYIGAKKSIISSVELISTAKTIANLLGNDELITHFSKITEVIENQ